MADAKFSQVIGDRGGVRTAESGDVRERAEQRLGVPGGCGGLPTDVPRWSPQTPDGVRSFKSCRSSGVGLPSLPSPCVT